MTIFADLALARRLERPEAIFGARFVEARSRLNAGSGAEWIEVAGAYAMFDGPASPVTQTFGLGLYAPLAAADLDRIESFFQERGAPAIHEVSPLAGLGVTDLLSLRGYRPLEFTSVMYQPLEQWAPAQAPPNVRLQTRLVADGEHDLWAQTSARGWSTHPEFADLLFSFSQVTASTEGALSFFAHLDGEPVATGALCCYQGVALLAGASTVPEARNQGAQRALLDARIEMATSVGCDLAMMCAEPGSTSQRNAERQGFRIAYTRIKWSLPVGQTVLLSAPD